MSNEVIMIVVSAGGRVTIPAKHRQAVGLEAGDIAVAHVENGEIRIRPVRDVLAELQGTPRKRLAGSGKSVDRLPVERREAASHANC
jgi:AbrB family looped-hinge helix DNA binding protein